MDTTRPSLLRDCQHGEKTSRWREFEEVYRPIVTAVLRKQNIPSHEVDSLVNQVFAKVWLGLASYDGETARFRTWLYKVAYNTAQDWWREAKKANRLKRDLIEEVGSSLVQMSEEPDEEWKRTTCRRVLAVVLERVRAEAEPETWICFEQHILQGRSAKEVALELGKTASAVYTNACRVLAKVRAGCHELMEELSDDR